MASRKTYSDKEGSHRAGFTLIEVLLVLGIVSVILGATLFFDMNTYRGTAFRAERDALVVALQAARADALNNINQHKHGVAIQPGGYNGYVIFEGDNYASSDPALRKEIPASYAVTFDLSQVDDVNDDIVFTQLSGNADVNGDIILIDPLRNATTSIAINYEGRIGW